MFGVRFGLTWRSSADAPATTGADIDVPLMYITLSDSGVKRSFTSESAGLSTDITLFGALCEMTLLPGATRSGLIRLSYTRVPVAVV